MSGFSAAALGPLLFGLALLLTLWARWPIYAALLTCSLWGGLLGLGLGWIDPQLLWALPLRLSGLLEHELLQALLLYALVGATLRELGLAEAWIAALGRRLGEGPLASALAVLGFAALSAPMSGSVAASLGMLRQGADAALAAWPRPRATALQAAASTLGLLLPPSLVLLLCGEAMMRAHTEALGQLGSAAGLARVMNNQDLLAAAWRPALLVLLGFALVAALVAALTRPRAGPTPPRAPDRRGGALPWVFSAGVLLMLLGVARGWWLAVEGAALAAALLLGHGLCSGRLRGRMAALLSQALQTAGMLFGLLLAASSFSWLLRALGSDVWLQRELLTHSLGGPGATLALILLVLLLCSLVLDAFELIFLILPLLMPVLLQQQTHAPWVAVLALLILQLGYLLPPLGYALLAARSGSGAGDLGLARLAAAVLPYTAVLMLVLGAVLCWPQALCGPPPRLETPALDEAQALDELLRQAPPPSVDEAPADAGSAVR